MQYWFLLGPKEKSVYNVHSCAGEQKYNTPLVLFWLVLFCLYISSFIWFKWLIYLHSRDCLTAPALNSEATIKDINKIDREQKHNKKHIVCLILGKAHKCNHKCPYFNDFSAKSPLNSEHVILHYDDVTWTSWSIKSPVIRLFVQQPLCTFIKWGEVTSDRWIPRTKGQSRRKSVHFDVSLIWVRICCQTNSWMTSDLRLQDVHVTSS